MSTSLRREYAEAIEDVLLENGVDEWDICQDGPHKKYKFIYNGRHITFSTPSTPSDCVHGAHNAVSDLRREMGVRRIIHKNPKNREKAYRRPQDRPRLVAPKITILPDPWEKLKGMEVIKVCDEPAAASHPVMRSPLRRVIHWIRDLFARG